jgi:hypothetical protein
LTHLAGGNEVIVYSMLKHCGPVIVSRPPKFAAPTSQLVSAAQFYEPEFVNLVRHLRLDLTP